MPTEDLRYRLEAAIQKPLPSDENGVGEGEFDPWGDIITGIYGGYSSESDELMLAAMTAARDRKTFDFIEKQGFAGEFMLYVLAGHGMLNYGTSPRGGWPHEDIADLWNALIDKWQAYVGVVWPEAK